jgi:hypothetical protein
MTMFATTPSLRDRIDLRKAALVAAIAAVAIGLQGAFLTGMVASPLGSAVASFDRSRAIESAPAQALAEAQPAAPRAAVAGVVQARTRTSGAVAHRRAAPRECETVATVAE